MGSLSYPSVFLCDEQFFGILHNVNTRYEWVAIFCIMRERERESESDI